MPRHGSIHLRLSLSDSRSLVNAAGSQGLQCYCHVGFCGVPRAHAAPNVPMTRLDELYKLA